MLNYLPYELMHVKSLHTDWCIVKASLRYFLLRALSLMLPLPSLLKDHLGLCRNCPLYSTHSPYWWKGEWKWQKRKTFVIINLDSHKRLNRILNKWEPEFATFNYYFFQLQHLTSKCLVMFIRFSKRMQMTEHVWPVEHSQNMFVLELTWKLFLQEFSLDLGLSLVC